MDNTGVNGVYLTQRRQEGRGRLGHARQVDDAVGQGRRRAGDRSPSSITPGNPGYPTYWHARGYGLFAANPLGQKELSDGKDTLNFAIEPNKSATFKHRIYIVTGGHVGRGGRGGVDEVDRREGDDVARRRRHRR